MTDQGEHVAAIDIEAIGILIGQPIAVAAPRNVGTDDPVVRFQSRGEMVEVAPVAGQAMDAEQGSRVGRIAPMGISQAAARLDFEAP